MKNGETREGILYSLMILLQKTGVGMGITASNYVFGLAGYINPDKETVVQEEDNYQPDAVLLSFRVLMTVVPVICLILALICISFINVSKEVLDEYEAKMEAEQRDLTFKPKPKPNDPNALVEEAF